MKIMKTLKLKFIGSLILISMIAACSLDSSDPECFFSVKSTITAVTGPETTTVNVPITLNAKFGVLNDCGEFNRFMETTTFPKIITAIVDYDGCECTNTPNGSDTKPYVFTAATAGTYELKFWKDTSSYITKTITVTE
jgi:hypothetical protein